MNATTQSTLALAQSSNTLTMSSREIAELVKSRHDSVKRTIERLSESGVIVQPPTVDEPGTDAMGRPRPISVYVFDLEHKRDSFVVVAQLSPEFTAALVDRWQELEGKQKFAVPTNLREALLLAADLEEKREAAEVRAIEAERTKALIGSRREATAMATASKEKRRADDLAVMMDYSRKYATVKRMQRLYPGQKFSWRSLKAASEELGIAPVRVFDHNYGEVCAYHDAAWRKAYDVGINQENADETGTV
jgi:phage regulator Rha-like protein